MEHLLALTFPLGMVFSALVLRAHDLDSAAARRYSEFRAALINEGGVQENGELELAALGATVAAGRHAEFVTLALTTAELMLPLLEGLALVAEMESDEATWGWLAAVNLEYLHFEHGVALTNRELHRHLLDPRVRGEVFRDLATAFDRQVEHSRERQLLGDLIRLVFRREVSDPNPERLAPYFYGYLFVRRLYQEWSSRVPDLEFSAFLHGATRLCYSVIPHTLLPIFSLESHTPPTASEALTPLFSELLEACLGLRGEEIRRLTEIDRAEWLLRLELGSGRLVPLFPEAADLDLDAQVSIEIMLHVFDAHDPEVPEFQETRDVLDEIGQAVRLNRVAGHIVLLVGVDEEERTVVLAEPARTRPGTEDSGQWLVGPNGATFFTFETNEELHAFMDLVRRRGAELPAVRLGEAPYRVPVPGQGTVAQLETFCFFWPNGVPRLKDGEVVRSAPVEIVRVIAMDWEGQPRACLSYSGGSAPANLQRLLRTRDHLNRSLSQSIPEILAPDLRRPQFILREIEAVMPGGSLEEAAAQLVLAQQTPERLRRFRTESRDTYARVLFPRATEELRVALSESKLEALAPLLGSDMSSLRRWLRTGSVLTPHRAAAVSTNPVADREAVERIQNIVRAQLGVPLILFRDFPARVELDLVPASE